MSTEHGRPHINPLVKTNQPALFQMDNGDWHRSETYPDKCTCNAYPMHAMLVKPAFDDSWRLGPLGNVRECVLRWGQRSAETGAKARAHASFPAARVTIAADTSKANDGLIPEPFMIGERVDFDPVAKERYEDGEWHIETVGVGPFGEPAVAAKIFNKQTGVYAWAPLTWLKRWEAPKAAGTDARPTADGPPFGRDFELADIILDWLMSRNARELEDTFDNMRVSDFRRLREELALILYHEGRPPNWVK